LSDNEFAEKYGASEEDLAKVSAFAREHHLNVIKTDAAHRIIIVTGTVAQVNKAFGVELQNYEHEVGQDPKIERYRGRDGFIHVPRELKDIVRGVFGLDNRNITKRNVANQLGRNVRTSPTTTVTAIHPSTLTDLYNFPTNSALGQTIGIVSLQPGGYQHSDINATFGGSPPVITDVPPGGNPGNPDPETTQDICIAGLVAPEAAIRVYFLYDGTVQSWVDMLALVAQERICTVLSSSFYYSDGDDDYTLKNDPGHLSPGDIDNISEYMRDLANLGITVCIASGDTGSDSKVGNKPGDYYPSNPWEGDGKAHGQYPATDPWVLSVGGTAIRNVNGSDFDEYVWNSAEDGGATGGGISDYFTDPPEFPPKEDGTPSTLLDWPSKDPKNWDYQKGVVDQKSVNDPHHVGRGFPDVAANASPSTGYKGIIVGGVEVLTGGTSASAPLWAGLIAVINAALRQNPTFKSVGFVNPALYALRSRGFRAVPNPAGGPGGNGFNNIPGYPASPSPPAWNACTGWGSINGIALLEGLRDVLNIH
jgi:kumamolisin